MVRRMVSDWLTPFGKPQFRKPSGWAESLKPDTSTENPSDTPKNLREGIRKAQESLLRKQNFEDGYWCAELRADTTLESDTIMLLNFLGRGDSPKVRRLAKFILSEQNADGGWPIYRNGPSEISATVKAYWALKFAGFLPEDTKA